jgi:RecF/RecN/SMC N terminal domain
MIRLRTIDITGFRGARFTLPLDFTKNYRSMAIYGENAHGKSTITDAVEWFLTKRVDHLWREDCREHALRHVKLRDTDDATVSVELSDPKLSGSKRLKPDFTVHASETKELQDYLNEAASERHILRNADLTTFIRRTKGEKRDVIAKIIGFDEIVAFRNVIQSTRNALQRDPQYLTAKQIVERTKAKLLATTGSILVTRADLYDTANELLKPYQPARTVTDDESYAACVADLSSTIKQQERLEKKLKLDRLKTACKDTAAAIATARESQKTFLPDYQKLVQNKEKLTQLNLEDFLRKGKEVLDLGLAADDTCPLCGNIVDRDQLNAEIEARIQELEQNRREYEAITTQKDLYVADLNALARHSEKLRDTWAGLEVPADFTARVDTFAGATAELERSISQSFATYQPIEVDGKREQDTDLLLQALEHTANKAESDASKLELQVEETAIVEVTRKLQGLHETFRDYEANGAIKRRYEEQINSLATIFDEFVAVQNRALQEALDTMSSDISKFHGILHPEEGIDSVRLRILGDEGVEFEYSFHGERTYPPVKYLSESQLNSLGIALFLASVKLFNWRSNFFVLDDVVTSFDAAHRRRLLRLLKEDFNDWQIILLTHEHFWFDLIKRELGPDGWLTKEVDWDLENGVQIKPSPKNLRDLIAKKRAEGFDVANDVRTLLERVLKELCHALGVKVAFLYNDRNERRMPGELLSALRATVNEKCTLLKGHAIFAKLEGSNVVGTTGSHDNPIALTEGDIDVALQDIDELEQLFRCGDCSGFVERERFVTGNGKIMCKCGRKEIAWKK